MSALTCHYTTFNCARTPINIDHFASALFNDLKTNLPPDLVVLSLQEIAPLGYSFIGGSLLTPYLSRFTTAVNAAATNRFEHEGGYERVVETNAGMTALLIFARAETARRVRWVETAGVGVGVLDMGNKGAAAARIGLEGDGEEDVVLTFAAVHLAPHEWGWEQRNRDWRSICEGLVFERDEQARGREGKQGDAPESEPLLESREDDMRSVQGSLFSPVSYVFFGGDLNYRTSDTAPDPEGHKKWPQLAISRSDTQDYSALFARDQLTREKKAGKTLHNMAEAEINFPPTYKYSSAAQKAAAEDTASDSSGVGQTWAKHRVPSWCDRILYLAAASLQIFSYDAGPLQPTSDHRPVSLSFTIPTGPLGSTEADVKSPFSVRQDWKEARAAAQRYELIVGVAAYLALTWEGEALLAGSVVGIIGGYLALRAMLGT
ncbi:uncharacterized protein LTR77_005158 [Saxophila tyrrhenica]|uniref:Inositol polyphosphate-related phosphatase domain-containing protein n=1 Tax=Saxophila tyrrhenica TaxID=1690608 RepID=A0AAV9PEE6_9PEZI|nr:hypothetical protein LTR77_005158 [Saxophila tyrrhenica]